MSNGLQSIRINSRAMLRQSAEATRTAPLGGVTGRDAAPIKAVTPSQRLRLRLFNVKYSPNLGDGLLSECLEKALIALGADNDTWSIDLAARKAYSDGLTARRHILSTLDRMPSWLRQEVVRFPLAIQSRRTWHPHYAAGLKNAGAIVIGGGNLISDIDLNFPTKLTLAIREAERLHLPFVVYASGVTGDWTLKGARMMRNAFASSQLRGVFVRDLDSKHLWDEALGEASGFEAVVVRDPGLLACEFIPKADLQGVKRPAAGVGIMSHIAVRYHSGTAPKPDYLEDWYVELVRELVAKGYHAVAFTNGSPEDLAYLDKLRPRLAKAAGNAISFPVQQTPEELCGIISALDVLVAYRMHAIIAAYSFGVPAVALAWDRKLKSFMTSVNRQDFLCDVSRISPVDAVNLAGRAQAEPVPPHDHKRVLEETWNGIRQLLDLLETAS